MEREIIDRGLINLQDTTRISGNFESGKELDGNLVLHFPHSQPLKMVVDIKRELRQHQVDKLIERKQQFDNYLLVAEKLFPSIKKQLQKEEIAYLEENGNFFLKTDNFFFLIDTNKPFKNKKNTGKKAFTKTGLKLVFHLLLDPELINSTQRSIAEKSGVSLGTVPGVITTLKDGGFLITHKKNFIWQNRKELLTSWINDYDKILKPKLFRARYELKKDWQKMQLKQGETHWGGEPAGDLLTGYLRPEEFILYSDETSLDLMKNYKLKPNPTGEVLFYEKFWKVKSGTTVPHLLVYTDLILKEDKRCRETAQKIFDEYIQPIL